MGAQAVSTNDGKSSDQLAALEYVGIPGISRDCERAVLRYIHFGDRVTHAAILTYYEEHCLLLTIAGVDKVAVKSGFGSGYRGRGARCFSYVLQLLESHGAEISEYQVTQEFLDRLDRSSLLNSDLDYLEDPARCRRSKWHDYIDEQHFEAARNGTLWQRNFPVVLPLALIDPRIMDLALAFQEGPDNSLLVGYRRLEDIIRNRAKIDQHGAKLFSRAFDPKGGVLTWRIADEGERAGRMQLFTGTFTAHRNRRAHRELDADLSELATEFLLLNHLYRLEREAIETSSA